MSGTPRVLICNERFLARFGVDRLLVLLAEHLVAAGAEVSFACVRAERKVLDRIGTEVLEFNDGEGLALGDADQAVGERLLAGWGERAPQAIVTGGWPFFTAAAAASGRGVQSVFIDAGAVPHDGLTPTQTATQSELRRLRQRTLSAIDQICPISQFIRGSQTLPDRGFADGVTTVRLGCDHLLGRQFDQRPLSGDERIALEALATHAAAGHRLILGLGRYEEQGYKNSAAAFDVLSDLRSRGTPAHLIVLRGGADVEVPADLRADVTLLDAISDTALVEVMRLADLGLSTSLWEGFNLPMAEMQWLGKPVVAFNVGAHPEVAADPWFLAQSQAEMASKAEALLSHSGPVDSNSFDRFRERFRWSDTLARWERVVLAPGKRASVRRPRRLVLMDVTNSSRDPANSGVIRVTRRLAAELAGLDLLDLLFVTWDAARKSYRLLSSDERARLALNGGAVDWLGKVAQDQGELDALDRLVRARDLCCPARPLLFFPEVVLDRTTDARANWVRSRGFATASILYDMLPVSHPHLVNEAVVDAFVPYVRTVAACDAVWSISDVSLQEYLRYTGASSDQRSQREAIWLPGQFGDHERVTGPATLVDDAIEILCVSTIEPRKNHRNLIEGFRLFKKRTNAPVRLVLVGNAYAGGESLADWMRDVARSNPDIVWRGVLSDEELARQYLRSRFTVYASLVEGFGLPVLESLWMGRPCLCHSRGVMAELGAPGGCLMVDMTDTDQIANGLELLVDDSRLVGALSRQAAARPIATWRDYAGEIGSRLQSLKS